MNRLASPRLNAKVAPTQSEDKLQQRDAGLPAGSHQSFPLQQTTKPPHTPKDELNKEQTGEQLQASPYEQPFTLEAALSLSLNDQTVPWYLQGYDLFMETRTSK